MFRRLPRPALPILCVPSTCSYRTDWPEKLVKAAAPNMGDLWGRQDPLDFSSTFKPTGWQPQVRAWLVGAGWVGRAWRAGLWLQAHAHRLPAAGGLGGGGKQREGRQTPPHHARTHP